MKIIAATINHLESVYELLCELENEILDKIAFTKIYQNNISNENIHYILAVYESNIIGFGSLHVQELLHHCAYVGEIQELVVSKEHQGTGVGTMLFNELNKIALTTSCQQLEVACNFLRKKSHKFYLKQGMKKSHYKFTCPLLT